MNDGTREFSTKVSEKQALCDGNWHKITGEDQVVHPKCIKGMMRDNNYQWQQHGKSYTRRCTIGSLAQI